MSNLQGRQGQKVPGHRRGSVGRWAPVAFDAVALVLVAAVVGWLAVILPRDGLSVVDVVVLATGGLAVAGAFGSLLVRVADTVRQRREGDDATWLEPWL